MMHSGAWGIITQILPVDHRLILQVGAVVLGVGDDAPHACFTCRRSAKRNAEETTLARPVVRNSGPRRGSRHGRPLVGHAPGRHGRRGDQGRYTQRRHRSSSTAQAGRGERGLPPSQLQQEVDHLRPQGRGRPRRGAPPGRRQRRAGGEHAAGNHRASGPGLRRGVAPQPQHRLLLGVRLGPRRPYVVPRRRRSHRPGLLRPPQHHRGSGSDAPRALPIFRSYRRKHELLHRRGHPRGPVPS